MSWEGLEVDQEKAKKSKAEIRERQVELGKSYNRCFGTEDGIKVLEDLKRRFLMDNDTPLNAQNVGYEAAYHNGESGVIKYVVHIIKRAEYL